MESAPAKNSSEEFEVLEEVPCGWRASTASQAQGGDMEELAELLHSLLGRLRRQPPEGEQQLPVKELLRSIAREFDGLVERSLSAQKHTRSALISLHKKSLQAQGRLRESLIENQRLRDRVARAEQQLAEAGAARNQLSEEVAHGQRQYSQLSEEITGSLEQASRARIFVAERQQVERTLEVQLAEVVRLLESRRYLFEQQYRKGEAGTGDAAASCKTIEDYVGQIARSVGIYQASVEDFIEQMIRERMGVQMNKRRKEPKDRKEGDPIPDANKKEEEVRPPKRKNRESLRQSIRQSVREQKILPADQKPPVINIEKIFEEGDIKT